MGAMSVVVTVMMMVGTLQCSITTQYFKELPGNIIQGHILVTISPATKMRCVSACVAKWPQCRGFNLLPLPSAAPSPAYSCQIMLSYSDLLRDPAATLFYDRDMYTDFGFHYELDRFVYYPRGVVSPGSWSEAWNWCKKRWSELLVPRRLTEWLWMLLVYQNQGYQGLFLPIKELGEAEYWDHGYMWETWKANSTSAPGILPIHILPDGKSCWNQPGWICDLKDCGRLAVSSVRESVQTVIIDECFNYFQGHGYICEAGMQDEDAYFMPHP